MSVQGRGLDWPTSAGGETRSSSNTVVKSGFARKNSYIGKSTTLASIGLKS